MPYKRRRTDKQYPIQLWLNRETESEKIAAVEALRGGIRGSEGAITDKELITTALHILYSETNGDKVNPFETKTPIERSVQISLERINQKVDALMDIVRNIQSIDISKLQIGDSDEIEKVSQIQKHTVELPGVSDMLSNEFTFDFEDDDDD